MEAQAMLLYLFIVCSSCNWKFVIRLVDGGCPFANGLNGLNGLAHLVTWITEFPHTGLTHGTWWVASGKICPVIISFMCWPSSSLTPLRGQPTTRFDPGTAGNSLVRHQWPTTPALKRTKLFYSYICIWELFRRAEVHIVTRWNVIDIQKSHIYFG